MVVIAWSSSSGWTFVPPQDRDLPATSRPRHAPLSSASVDWSVDDIFLSRFKRNILDWSHFLDFWMSASRMPLSSEDEERWLEDDTTDRASSSVVHVVACARRL